MPSFSDWNTRTNPGGAGPNDHPEWASQAKPPQADAPAPDFKVIVEVRKTSRGIFVAAIKEGDDFYTANNRTLAGALNQVTERLTSRGVFDDK